MTIALGIATVRYVEILLALLLTSPACRILSAKLQLKRPGRSGQAPPMLPGPRSARRALAKEQPVEAVERQAQAQASDEGSNPAQEAVLPPKQILNAKMIRDIHSKIGIQCRRREAHHLPTTCDQEEALYDLPKLVLKWLVRN